MQPKDNLHCLQQLTIPQHISTIIFGNMYDYRAPPTLQTFNAAFCFQKPSTYILPLACQTSTIVKLHSV